ncbi:integrator complex subunit 6 isoform X2 [Boleophthalmus pectinirostris]|uniref:integrator complex subunit 6 isoform X2 n=1 Tax=Boleophthalmus pectinirostris TaxID=150288 RepID=UPI00242AFE6E|nr:integrator complex subunit 6 isoform X2 [Boleophthalmus pectinirostris]
MYLKTMPPYYLLPLKKAMRMMGAPNLIADNLDCGLSYSVISYLKKLSQQAKMESDRLIVSVGKKAPQETGIKVKNQNHCGALSLAHRRDFKQLLQGITGEGPLRVNDINYKEFAGFQIGLLNKDVKPQAYRNAYDIPRRNLLDQLTRMRSNLLRTSQKLIRGQDEDYLHSIPVAQMGNYQEYLKMMPSPLREIDPDQPKRLHTFGNPFKQDKKGMMIDEADEFVTGPQNKKRVNSGDSMSSSVKRRRSMSPLLRRPLSPIGNTNHIKSPAQNHNKPAPPHKDNGNNIPESNGEVGPECGEVWPNDTDSNMGNQISPSSETKPRPGTTVDQEDAEVTMAEERAEEEEGVEEQMKDEKYNCDRLSPQSNTESSETEPEALQTVYIPPLDGTQAELRTRVIKEVRKPGRNYEAIMRLLHEVKGPVNVQKYFLLHAIKEAARFKKRVLIQQLEQVLSELEDPPLNSVPSPPLPNDNNGKS